MILRNRSYSVFIARTVWSGNAENFAVYFSPSLRSLFGETNCFPRAIRGIWCQSVLPVSINTSFETGKYALSKTECPSQDVHYWTRSSSNACPHLLFASWQPSQQCAAATSLASSPLQAIGVHWIAATALGTWSVRGVTQHLESQLRDAAHQRRSLQSCSLQTRVSEANALMQVGLQHPYLHVAVSATMKGRKE